MGAYPPETMSFLRVSRNRSVDGLVTPAFMRNGKTFFFVDLAVFEDGLVGGWELLDLQSFHDELKSGRVTPCARDGAEISVHGLGAWWISDGQWDLDADALAERVDSMLRELNLNPENIRSRRGTAARVSTLGSAKKRAVRIVDPHRTPPRRVTGDALSVFVHDGDYRLASLRVFKDGVVELERLAQPETMDHDALARAVEAGRVVGTLPPGARVHIHGLGSFVAATASWSTSATDQLREARDILDRLNDRPDSIARCKAAYEAYSSDPQIARLDALREAYEAVPEIKRLHVEGMEPEEVPPSRLSGNET
jgi:hypothetical protein